MLNIKNKVLISLLIFLFSISIFAQRRGANHMFPHDSSGLKGPRGRWADSSNSMFERRKEKLEKLKVWRMVDYLNLSSQQSEKFFPKYHKYKEKLRNHHKNMESVILELDNKLRREEYDPDESDLNKYLNKLAQIRENRSKIKKEFLKNVDGILNTKQKMKLLIFEDKFKRQIMRELHRMRGKGKQPNLRR